MGPGGTSVLPAAGLWVFTMLEELVQLSVAVNCGIILGMVAVQFTIVLGGQAVIVGAMASRIITVVKHELAKLPPASRTFRATTLTPVSAQVNEDCVRLRSKFWGGVQSSEEPTLT